MFVAASQAELDDALTRSFSRVQHPTSSTHFLDPNLGRTPTTVHCCF